MLRVSNCSSGLKVVADLHTPPDTSLLECAPMQLLGREDLASRARVLAAIAVLIVALRVLWPAPAGVLVQGAVIGGLTALIAFGIALVYRSSRVVNFAQGDLGAAPAVLGVLLIGAWDWPFLPALLASLVAGAVLGAVVELTVVRRFFKSPRLILSVATLGLAQVLAGVALLLPQWFDTAVAPNDFSPPIDVSFEIAPLTFDGNDIVAMIAVPVVLFALGAFLRYTSLGIAVRASADSTERAFLAGIPVKRVQTFVWVLAAMLASLAVFLRAGIVGLPIGQVLGPAILLRSLAAAAIGRMEHLPTILAAAIGLGVLEQSIVWDTRGSTLVAPILFVVVLSALLVQRGRRVARGDADESWSQVREARPIPRELADLPEVRWGLRGLAVLGVLGLALAPLVLPGSRTNLLGAILILAIIGLSLVVLTGWAGQVSLGQMGVVGIGAASAGALATRAGVDVLLAILVAGLVGAVVAVVIGLPALRLSGLFLAVTTLAFAQATAGYVLNQGRFGWWLPQGRIERTPIFGRIDISSEAAYYELALVGLVAALVAVRGIRRARPGRVLVATRHNERCAQAMGIRAVGTKLTAFAVSGFLAGYAGGLFVFHQQGLGITSYAPEQSLVVFTTVVIGGMGSMSGALLGAFYVKGIDYFLPAELSFLAGGFGLLFVLWLAPGGLGSLLYHLRDGLLRWTAHRRRLVVPSLVADARDYDVVARRRARVDLDALKPAVLAAEADAP